MLIGRRRCAASACTQKPAYNHAGETKAMYCEEHRAAGMVSTILLALLNVCAEKACC